MKGILPLLFATATLATTAHAQNATTTPVGAMTFSFPATTAITTTTLAIPLIATPVFTGAVGTLSATAVSVTGGNFTAGAYATAAQPYFVRFTSGNQAGRTIKVTANTADTLTLDTSDNSSQTTALNLAGWAIAPGDSFSIIPGDTLATLFGDNTAQNALVFVGGTSTFNADSVSIYNKTVGMWDAYFFSTSQGGWRQKGDNVISKNNVVIYPEASVSITRRSARPATAITLLGDVPNVVPLTKTTGSISTMFVSSRFPTDVTLSSLGLSNWKKGSSTFNADSISIYNTLQGKWDVYFQLSSNSQWRMKGDNVIDRSNVVIPAGTAIGITKRDATSGSASFLKSATLPYSL